jgi:hypothetical protein
MHQTEFQHLSVLYLYGELSGHRKKRFEEHLSTCEGCRKEFEELKETFGLLSELPAENPAPDLRRIVLEKAIAHRDRKKSLTDLVSSYMFRFRKVLRFGLAMVFMFVGIFMIISHITPQNSSQNHQGIQASASPSENANTILAANIDGDIDTLNTQLKSAEMDSRGASDVADLSVDSSSGSRFYPQFSDPTDYGEYMSLKSEADDIVKMMKSF